MAKPELAPTIGSIVQFHFDHGVRVTRPAIVVDVVPDKENEPEGRVALQVFFKPGDEWVGATDAVPFAEDRGRDPKTLPKKERVQPATWSWLLSAAELDEARKARIAREKAERIAKARAELAAAMGDADE